MTEFNQTIDKIKQLIEKDPDTLVIKPEEFDSPAVKEFVDKALGATSLTIKQPKLGNGEPTIQGKKETSPPPFSVTGKTDAMQFTGTCATLTINEVGDFLEIDLVCHAGKEICLDINPINWLKFKSPVLKFWIKSKYHLPYFKLTIEVDIDDAPGVPLSVMQDGAGEFRIEMRDDKGQTLTIDHLLHLAGINANKYTLPQVLHDALEDISLRSIASSFSIDPIAISYFNVDIHISKGITLIPGVIELGRNAEGQNEGMDLCLSLKHPIGPGEKQLTAILSGNIVLDTTPPIAIPLFVETDIDRHLIWKIGIEPGKKVKLPSFAHLLTMTGCEDLEKHLPKKLADIPAINIYALELDIEDFRPKNFGFAVGTDESWSVIDDHYFDINKIYFKLIVTDIPGNRSIQADIRGQFQLLKEVFILCEIQKSTHSSDWILRGGLPPDKTLNLSHLAQRFFGDHLKIPDSFPDLVVTRLMLTVVPLKGSFDFEAGLENQTKSDYFNINSFDIHFFRHPIQKQDGKNWHYYHAEISTTLTIASVELTISAMLEKKVKAGLKFETKTKKGKNIPIGELIADVAEKFKVDSAIPKAIQSITVSDLDLAFDTLTKDFTFSFSSHLHLLDSIKPLDATIYLHVNKVESGYKKQLMARFKIGDYNFEVDLESDPNQTRLIAVWVDEGHSFNIRTFLEKLKVDASLYVTDQINFDLKALLFQFDNDEKARNKSIVIAAKSEKLGFGYFVVSSKDSKNTYLLGIGLDGSLHLSNIPFIGHELKSIDVISFEKIKFMAASDNLANFTMPELPESERLPKISGIAKTIGLPKTISATKGIEIDGVMKIADYSFDFALPLFKPKAKPGKPKALPGNANQKPVQPAKADEISNEGPSSNVHPTDDVKWINLQKAVSVFQFQRIGIQFKNKRIKFLLDAGIKKDSFELMFYGLFLSFIPTGDVSKIQPEMGLNGMNVMIHTGSIEVQAGLLASPNPKGYGSRYYSGDAVIQAGDFGLSGIGSYTEDLKNPDAPIPSLFIYGFLAVPIGLPAIKISGLAAGFGFNRAITIPPLKHIPTFALVAAATGGDIDPGKLNENFPMEIGNFWGAAGIKLTFLETLDGLLLAVLSGGTNFEIALLGMGKAGIDKGNSDPPILLEVVLKASYSTKSGLLSFCGAFTQNTHIVLKQIKLEGGFALCTWLSGTHKGDFVFTIGGYHPHFKVPPHYPQAKRLGLNWNVDNHIVIRMDIYLALTHSCIMFGGLLDALVSFWVFRAWFNAKVDFLLAWKPFYFEGEIKISVGAAVKLHIIVTINISLSLTADLRIWGPEIQGVARLDLKIFSFTVHFGRAGEKPEKSIFWDDFKKSFLTKDEGKPALANDSQSRSLDNSAQSESITVIQNPSPSEICTAHIQKGLVKEIKKDDSLIGWIVKPGNLVITTSTKIPAKKVRFNDDDIQKEWTTDFGLGLVKVNAKDFKTELTVLMTNADPESTEDEKQKKNYFSRLETAPITNNIGKAMWNPDSRKVDLANAGGEQAQIQKALTGLRLKAYTQPSMKTSKIPIDILLKSGKSEVYQFQEVYAPLFHQVIPSDTPFAEIAHTIHNDKIKERRKNILEALKTLNNDTYAVSEDVRFSHPDKQDDHGFIAPPVLCSWHE